MKKIILTFYSLFIFLFIIIKIHNFNTYNTHGYNFDLFTTIKKYELNFPSRWSIINQTANIFPFIGLGIIIKLVSLWNIIDTFLVILPILIILESFQITFGIGTFDVDDIWLNVLSVLYGYIIYSGGKK